MSRGFFRVPLAIRCDRLFFERPDDAVYIDRMAQYLADDSLTTPPILDPDLYRVFVTEDRTKASQHRLMWATLIMRKKVMTHEDFFTARRAAMDVNKATVPVTEDEPILSIPWDLLPSVPDWLAEFVDLRSAPVPPIRALTYFTNTARNLGSAAYKKWNKALQFELVLHVIVAHYAAWARPVLDQPRLWYPSQGHVQWLKRFVELPSVPVYFEALGKYIKVSVRDVVRILDEARTRAVPTKRRDYCTKTTVEFVVTPNSHVYVNDPLREVSTRIASRPSNTVVKPANQGAVSNKPSALASKQSAAPTGMGKNGVLTKLFRKDQLRKQSAITDELLEGLNGSGLYSAADIVNHLVSHSQALVKSNDSIMSEMSQLQVENRRLRDDVQRYRDDFARVSAELRSLRDPYNPYDSGRSGTSRGWSDPYDRNYGYERRY